MSLKVEDRQKDKLNIIKIYVNSYYFTFFKIFLCVQASLYKISHKIEKQTKTFLYYKEVLFMGFLGGLGSGSGCGGGDSFIWIIILLMCGGCGGGCGNECDNGGSICGGGSSLIFIILLLCCCGGGNKCVGNGNACC